MKQLFYIEQPGADDSIQQVLSLQVGEKHCGFAISDRSNGQLYKLGYYSADENDGNILAALFEQHSELNNSFYQVIVAYEQPNSALIPFQVYNADDAGLVLKTMYGVNAASTIISESIAEWQLYNVYAVPKNIHDWISKKIPTGKYWHQYSVGIKNLHAAETGGHIIVDVRINEFTVLAAASGKLLLTQAFDYSTHEDVLYYLLLICQQYGLLQQEVKISLSGLIDQESALYTELYQYFIHITFREAGWTTGNNEFPAHYFTSLNDLAKCAS